MAGSQEFWPDISVGIYIPRDRCTPDTLEYIRYLTIWDDVSRIPNVKHYVMYSVM